ncbi:MAG: hypothetical protein IPN70_02545 [Candidatus Moraniibacteriota bacterium]|nr:MAG: hypothetical protein IPN70_02545 [Candidatus Moranbacteria bacterium]
MPKQKYPFFFYPMLLDNEKNQGFSKTFIDHWMRQKKLPEKRGLVLVHSKTTEWIAEISKKYNFSENQTTSLSRIIRDFGLNDIKENEIPLLIQKSFSAFSEEQKKFLENFIVKLFQIELPEDTLYQEEIPKEESKENSLPKESIPQSPKLTLLEALIKYPRIGQQLITSQNIVMRGAQEPVRPSIKNWITLYQQEMGPSPHETFERGNFLFQNQNATRLSPRERELIHEILKSLDENKPLPINQITQEIRLDEIMSSSQGSFSKEKTSPSIQTTSNQKKDLTMNSGTLSLNSSSTKKDNLEYRSEEKPSYSKQDTAIASNTQSTFQGLRIGGENDNFFSKKTLEDSLNTKNISFSSGQKFPGEE